MICKNNNKNNNNNGNNNKNNINDDKNYKIKCKKKNLCYIVAINTMRKKKSFKIQKKKNILLKLLRYELINDNVL